MSKPKPKSQPGGGKAKRAESPKTKGSKAGQPAKPAKPAKAADGGKSAAPRAGRGPDKVASVANPAPAASAAPADATASGGIPSGLRVPRAGAHPVPQPRSFADKPPPGGALGSSAAPAGEGRRALKPMPVGRPTMPIAAPPPEPEPKSSVARFPAVTLAQVRAHWHRKQGLGARATGTLAQVVAKTGWVRTLGGVDVYFSMRARVPGFKRAQLDDAVAAGELKVMPAVRGCIYLVPASDSALALSVAEEPYRKRMERDFVKAGVVKQEIEDLGGLVLGALAPGPKNTDDLRAALPETAIRSLGAKGKAVGIATTLPPTLRDLEFKGKIERTLEGGRLDTERYLWRAVPADRPAIPAAPRDPVDRIATLLKGFLTHSGPASLADFCDWAGIPQKEGRAAVDRIPAVPVTIEGYAEEAFVLEADLPSLREGGPAGPTVSFLAFEDNYVVLHGGPALLAERKHHGRRIELWGTSREVTLTEARHMSMRGLVLGDRLAGLWEFDPDESKVIVAPWERLTPAGKSAVDEAAVPLAAFIRDELGHARSFALDTMEAVRGRVRRLRVQIEDLARAG
jgi:hypothetical protein